MKLPPLKQLSNSECVKKHLSRRVHIDIDIQGEDVFLSGFTDRHVKIKEANI